MQALGDQVPIALHEPEHEHRAVAHVGRRVVQRHGLGQGLAGELGAHGLVRHDEHGLQAGGRVEARGAVAAADDEPPAHRRGDVVGMALELGGVLDHVGVELEEVVRGHQPGDVRRRARAQPAAQRDVRPDAELEVVGRVQTREAAHGEVAVIAGDLQVGANGEATGLDDLELHVERQRTGEAVEPRAEVRRGGGHADETTALHGPATISRVG